MEPFSKSERCSFELDGGIPVVRRRDGQFQAHLVPKGRFLTKLYTGRWKCCKSFSSRHEFDGLIFPRCADLVHRSVHSHYERHIGVRENWRLLLEYLDSDSGPVESRTCGCGKLSYHAESCGQAVENLCSHPERIAPSIVSVPRSHSLFIFRIIGNVLRPLILGEHASVGYTDLVTREQPGVLW